MGERRGKLSLWKKRGKKITCEQKYCAEILKNSSNSQIDRPARSQIILTGEVISLTFLQVCKRVRDIGTNNDDNQFSVQAFSPYVWAGFFFLHNAERALLISIHILREGVEEGVQDFRIVLILRQSCMAVLKDISVTAY